MREDYHLHTWGHSGPPLLLLHGFTGDGASWAAHGMAFVNAGYRVLAPDLLGHGQSAAPDDPRRYAMDQAAADLAAIIRGQTAGPVHLLGYSMGGRLALYLALTHPALVDALILESASPGLATEAERAARRKQDNALAARIEQEGIEAFVAYWESLPLWKSQSRLDLTTRNQLRAQRLQNRPHGLANSLRGMGTGVQPNLWPRLASLRVPTLLIAGAEDEKFVAINRRMAAAIPDARLYIVPEAGHTVHLERPAHFRRAVLDFLTANSRPAA